MNLGDLQTSLVSLVLPTLKPGKRMLASRFLVLFSRNFWQLYIIFCIKVSI